MRNLFKLSWLVLACATTVFMVSCEDDDDPALPPIGGYNTSDEVGATSLVAKWSFDDNLTESKQSLSGTGTNATFTTGAKGKAYQGSSTAFVKYANPGTAIPALKSFTTSMWINTAKHDGGAQCLFMLSKEGSFWGNFFMLIEGNNSTTHDSMFLKVHFEKNDDATMWKEQWIEHNGSYRIPNAYGKWMHFVASYDATASKYAFYVNGAKVALPETFTLRYNNNPADGGTALGDLKFINTNNGFVIGGFQNHLGAPFSAPEPWMLPYTGALDEFRIYSKALADADVNALYELEKAGR